MSNALCTCPATAATAVETGSLHRKIGWAGAFWVASGVPALVLFLIGSIAATVGKPSWLWIVGIGGPRLLFGVRTFNNALHGAVTDILS